MRFSSDKLFIHEPSAFMALPADTFLGMRCVINSVAPVNISSILFRGQLHSCRVSCLHPPIWPFQSFVHVTFQYNILPPSDPLNRSHSNRTTTIPQPYTTLLHHSPNHPVFQATHTHFTFSFLVLSFPNAHGPLVLPLLGPPATHRWSATGLSSSIWKEIVFYCADLWQWFIWNETQSCVWAAGV